MKTIWTKGLKTAQQRTEVKQEFIKGAPLRERLKLLLEEKIDSKRREVRNSNTYESPSWALVQADAIGYEKALFEVISLIIDEKVQKPENKE